MKEVSGATATTKGVGIIAGTVCMVYTTYLLAGTLGGTRC